MIRNEFVCPLPTCQTNTIEFWLALRLLVSTMQRALLWPLALLLAFIFLSMPEIVPRTQVARRDFSAFQVPCGNVGCKRFFKTTAGRTKHILSAHPIVSPPSSPEPHISHPNDITDNPFQDGELLGQPNGDGDEASRASPPPNVHTEFFGPGNSLYRNYHTLLDGSFLHLSFCSDSNYEF